MIDLHCHILPGIDDGAKSLDMSLAMARMAVADGITTLACTPHIYPGMYMNDAAGIAKARDALQAELDARSIALRLVCGADVHLVPEVLDGLRSGRIPTLHGGRYLLLEPSHTTPPPRFEAAVFDIVASGYTPIITHPERLTWVEKHYPVFQRLAERGVWMQLTAGSLTGLFGPRARHWAERFLKDGHTHLLASDGHSDGRRVPRLSEGVAIAEGWVGAQEAQRLVLERPQAVLDDRPADACTPPSAAETSGNLWRRWWQRWQN